MGSNGKKMLVIFLITLAVLILVFIIFKLVSKGEEVSKEVTTSNGTSATNNFTTWGVGTGGTFADWGTGTSGTDSGNGELIGTGIYF